MANHLGATFVPGGFDDYYMPEVVAPAPQRVTPQVPQNMQDGLQRMELEAREVQQPAARHAREPSLSHYMGSRPPAGTPQSRTGPSAAPTSADTDITAYQNNDSRTKRLDTMAWDSPSFSPFPKVKGDSIPPADDEKEEILWNARKHVLHSQNVNMQITWARDVLSWAEISAEAAARDTDNPRAATPRIEHELRLDAVNIINYLARQEHPDALYIRSKWLEFGKFGNRVDKREAYAGYRLASELGNVRSEYRMGMLFEQSNDMSKAREHYYKGLSLKDSASLYRMGMMTLLGQHGESKDFPRGIERIREAADTADEDAPQGAYVYGMLVGRDLPDIHIPEGLLPQNTETARMYIEKAAYLGFAKAQLKMGQAYELCQFGCELNPAYSLHYYGLAAKQGLPEAALGVSRWFLFGYEGVFKKNEELAFKYAQEAANAKLATGAFAIGYYHEIGIHVKKNISEARRWYQVAADQGNKDAIGRLESLELDRSLSKEDHETTTLTRIKSQHGSMRGKRPDRFKQPQQMAAVTEQSGPSTPVDDKFRISPRPSPDSRPYGADQSAVRAPSPAGYSHQQQQQQRPRSTAPYPDDDRPPPLNLNQGRARSTAPYPDEDSRGTSPRFNNQGGRLPVPAGPAADRPGSAFGIKTQPGPGPGPGPRPMPTSQSMGNLHPASQPDLRGRAVSGPGQGPGPGPAGFRHSAGPPPHQAPYGNEAQHGRPTSAAPYPNQGARLPPGQRPTDGSRNSSPHGGLPPAGADARYGYGARPVSRGGEGPPNNRFPQQQHGGRLDRVSTGQMPPHAAMSGGLPPGPMGSGPQGSPKIHALNQPPGPGPVRVGTAPPAQMQSPAPSMQKPEPKPGPAPVHSATAPAKPGKGPATFEDMGIPQGKQDGDCWHRPAPDGAQYRACFLVVANTRSAPPSLTASGSRAQCPRVWLGSFRRLCAGSLAAHAATSRGSAAWPSSASSLTGTLASRATDAGYARVIFAARTVMLSQGRRPRLRMSVRLRGGQVEEDGRWLQGAGRQCH
ncbi:hypothetical protein S40293_05916 [Stachybotrys chartarum IBT 40293]|nr:hypothetical protein S40293_05916 [Stachybotrys chartarum IBT 40293]